MNRYVVPHGQRLVMTLLLAASASGALAQDRPKNLTLLGIPSATVAPHGVVFGALSGTTRRSGSDEGEVDGSLALGFGLGNAEDAVGVQFTVQTTSLTSSFGDSGYLAFKASRRIAAGAMPTYLGLSVDHIGNWGDAEGVDARGAVMLTSFTQMQFSEGGEFFPLMFTLGVGSDLRDNDSKPGVFGGVGIGLTENFGASLAYNGENVDLGTSFRIDRLENVGFTAVANDVFDEDDSRRVTFTVSYFLRNAFGG